MTSLNGFLFKIRLTLVITEWTMRVQGAACFVIKTLVALRLLGTICIFTSQWCVTRHDLKIESSFIFMNLFLFECHALHLKLRNQVLAIDHYSFDSTIIHQRKKHAHDILVSLDCPCVLKNHVLRIGFRLFLSLNVDAIVKAQIRFAFVHS